MGLAASQARFLAITSRKMNCEFQSMQIAQEKLSVTRDLQKAAKDYQQGLAATKLVWDDHTDTYDLSYDLLMQPSAINEFDPYLVTDTQGKIVLSKNMFAAAQKAGIIDGAGNVISSANHPSKAGRDLFIDALSSHNAILASNANIVKNNTTIGWTKSGLGGEIFDKTNVNGLNSTAFATYMKKATYSADIKDSSGTVINKAGSLVYGLQTKVPTSSSGSATTDIKLKTLFNNDGTAKKLPSPSTKDILSDNTKLDKGQYVVTKNGSAVSKSELEKLTLGDILTGKYEITYRGESSDGLYSATSGNSGVAYEFLEEFARILGKDAGNDYKGLNVDTESAEALQMAFDLTISDCLQSSVTSKGGNVAGLTASSHDMNTIVRSGDYYSLSLTNLLKTYLTNFAVTMDGWDETPFLINKEAKKSTYANDDLNYTFMLANTDGMVQQEDLVTDFYNMLYNQICQQGASADANKMDMINDREYLTHGLKNGQLFISSLREDGYFYQGPYSLVGYVAEVADDDAIAQAEAEYNYTKSKLNYKEETLDLQMKNLDTEISALTTEFDTVKNLISKGVEKVFTMFST